MLILKIGGGKAIKENLDNILSDFASHEGKKLIVHGANHEMKLISEKMGLPERMITSPSGFTSRYTEKQTIEVFEMVYAGVANKRIVEKLHKHGVNAVGLSGLDGGLLRGKRKPYVKSVEDGKVKILRDDFTGTVESVNTDLLSLLMDNGYVPVIAPPAISEENEAINVDNDRIVDALCRSLKVATVISLFEAPGLLRDHEDPTSLIPDIDKSKVDEFMQFAEGRMKKKILHAIDSSQNVRQMILADGRTQTPVSDALEGKGTVIR